MKSSLIWLCLIMGMVGWMPAQAADNNAKSNAQYYQIEEPFTINFQNQSQQKVQYLQVKVALMSHQATALTQAEQNLPMLQDALRNLFTQQTYETVSTLDGREQLQQAALDLVGDLLEQETGSNGLDQVYFTSFILQ